jgi:DNA-directed RNA polymerase beta subunit
MLNDLLYFTKVINGVQHEIKVLRSYFVRPYQNGVGLDTPISALMHGNYDAVICGDIKYTTFDIHNPSNRFENVVKDFMFAEVPAMLGSILDHQHTGMSHPDVYSISYMKASCFINNMHVKILPSEEFLVNNRILHRPENGTEVRSTFFFGETKNRTNSTLQFIWQCKNNRKLRQWNEAPRFLFRIPYEKPPVFASITLMVMALGYSEVQFAQCVRRFRRLPESVHTAALLDMVLTDISGCRTTEEAQLAMSKCFKRSHKMARDDEKIATIKIILRKEIFPHLQHYSLAETPEILHWECYRKMIMFAMILADSLDREDGKESLATSRSYRFIRFKTPVQFMLELMRKDIKSVCSFAMNALQKMVNDKATISLENMIQPSMFHLTSAIKNGNFNPMNRTGGSHSLNKTQAMTLGYCSDSYVEQTGKIIKKQTQQSHDLKANISDPSQNGYVCLYLTPQNENCGVFRHKAMGARFTPFIDMVELQKWIDYTLRQPHQGGFVFTPIAGDWVGAGTTVFDVFGGIMGWVDNPMAFYRFMVNQRRRGLLFEFTNIEYLKSEDQIWFNVSGDRIVRPLFIAESLPALIQRGLDSYRYEIHLTSRLRNEQIIEFLDPNEEQSGVIYVAETIEAFLKEPTKYTHVEIHMMMSLAVSMNRAFFNLNSGPRMLYTGVMTTKALSTKLPDVGCTKSHMVLNQQFPIISDPITEALSSRYIEPNGTNAIVCFLPTQGNMEDSVQLKRGCVDRGMFMSLQFNMETVNKADDCELMKPDHTCPFRSPEHVYRHLGEDGIVKIGSVISPGDAIVGMVNLKKRKIIRCVSHFMNSSQGGRVTKVTLYPEKNPRMVHVTYVSQHIPTEGDKFFIGHGQKFTVAQLVNDEDMPFCGNEGSPDIIINSQSISRSTTGMFLDILFGKARTMSPDKVNPFDTVFTNDAVLKKKIDAVECILGSHGMCYKGTEMMYNGETGELMECPIFKGPIYVHVLKHMASDKMRYCDQGPFGDLTRDPLRGIRYGEMENWNSLSHGLTQMFRGMNTEEGAKFCDFFWCKKHSMPALGSIHHRLFLCTACGNSDHVRRLKLPYQSILVMRETYAAHMGHFYNVEDIPEDSLPFIKDDTEMIWDYHG